MANLLPHMLDPEQRKKIVDDAIKNAGMADPRPNSFDSLVAKLTAVTQTVQAQALPTIQAGGWKDKEALRSLLYKLYSEKLYQFSKDELEVAIALLLVDKAMNFILNSPFGEGPVNSPRGN